MRSLWLRVLLPFVLWPAFAHAQLFQNPPLTSTPFDPQTMAAADLNHDGKLDLVYTDPGNSNVAGANVHILLGNGDGTFSNGATIAMPLGICACAVNIADVNNDQIPDIVLGSNGATATISVLLGNGDGTFQSPIVSTFAPVIASGGNPFTGSPLAVADVNSDGNPDLLVPDAIGGAIYVLTGDGKGHFSLANTLQSFAYPYQAFAADINGDDKPDLVVFGLLGNGVTVFLGKGNAKFAAGVNYTLPAASRNVVFTDVNNDGHPDIVASTYSIDSATSAAIFQIAMLPGKSDGTFGPLAELVPNVPENTDLVAVQDVNDDGHLDLVALSDQGASIYFGQSGGKYSSPTSFVGGASTFQNSALGKFTSAGSEQLAIGVYSGIVLLKDLAPGAGTGPAVYDVGHPVGAIAVADFNADNHPDIAAGVAAYDPRILLGKGDGTFSLLTDQNTSYPTGFIPSLILATGNFSGNGETGILDGPFPAAGNTEFEYTLSGNGNGTFGAPQELSDVPVYFPTFDLNNDGLPDFLQVSSGNTISPGTITSYIAQKGGGYTTVNTTLRLSICYLVAAGDLNHDGIPDVILYCGDLEVWLGTGTGAFKFASALTIPNSLNSVNFTEINVQPAVIADIDGDGNPDLTLADGQILIYYGDGKGDLAPPVYYYISHPFSNVSAVDINQDGKTDLVLNDANGIAVLLNTGSRNFGQEQHLVAGANLGPVIVKDLNHDGYPDITVANTSASTIAVLLNQSTVAGDVPVTPNGKLTVTPVNATVGQAIGISILLSAPTSSQPEPGGLVDFYLDRKFLAAVTLSSGSATFTLSPSQSAALYAGTHSIVAAYSGDTHYAATSFAAALNTTEPSLATATTLKANSLSLLASQTLHLTATVTCPGHLPTGSVTFRDGTKNLGHGTLNPSGVAIFDTNLLAAGSHSITATYNGLAPNNGYSQPGFAPSTSAALTVTVSSYATTTTLAVNSSKAPTEVLTATVTSTNGTPFGAVAFYDSSTLLGVSSLLNGKASWTASSLAPGAHNLKAVYQGNYTFAASSSASQTVTVNASPRHMPVGLR